MDDLLAGQVVVQSIKRTCGEGVGILRNSKLGGVLIVGFEGKCRPPKLQKRKYRWRTS